MLLFPKPNPHRKIRKRKKRPQGQPALCPDGCGRVGMGVEELYAYDGKARLVCAACGEEWVGTDEEVRLAREADAYYHWRESIRPASKKHTTKNDSP